MRDRVRCPRRRDLSPIADEHGYVMRADDQTRDPGARLATTEAALQAARADGTSPILITPEGAASFYGAGYLGALQERAETEFPDVAFELIVDCGDAPGHALACLRAGVKRISMSEPNDKIADIARQMGAELVRRPT